MLESLMEIEVAFSLLKAGDAVKDKDPIDAHYEKLNTEIEVTTFFFSFFIVYYPSYLQNSLGFGQVFRRI
jgi:hypothetical protein